MDVRGEPTAQILPPGGFRVGVVGAAEDGDEDVGVPEFSRAPFHDGDGGPGEVHEELLPGFVLLPEDHVHLPPETPVALAELRVLQAVGILGLVFEPEQLQRHALAGEFPVHLLGIGLGTAHRGGSSRWVKAGVQGRLVEVLGKRPGKMGYLRPADDVRHRVGGDGHAAADLPAGEPELMMEPQDLLDLTHG